jgi:hypothetical protein
MTSGKVRGARSRRTFVETFPAGLCTSNWSHRGVERQSNWRARLAVRPFTGASTNDAAISRAVEKSYDLTPSGIISFLQLRRPVFQKTASYGHFGRNEPNFLWEKINKATELAKACN